jgi:hypothetical protein
MRSDRESTVLILVSTKEQFVSGFTGILKYTLTTKKNDYLTEIESFKKREDLRTRNKDF